MLTITQTQLGRFDLAQIGNPEETALAITRAVVYGILFTDQRAPAGRVADPFDQRGWWHNPTAGTGLWYVRRQALSAAARRETVGMIKTALEAEPGMREIKVSDVTPAGNVSSVFIECTGYYDETSFSVVLTDRLLPTQVASSEVWTEHWTEPWIDNELPTPGI